MTHFTKKMDLHEEQFLSKSFTLKWITKIISDKLRATLKVDYLPFFLKKKKINVSIIKLFVSIATYLNLSISVNYINFLPEMQSQSTDACSFLFILCLLLMAPHWTCSFAHCKLHCISHSQCISQHSIRPLLPLWLPA